MPNRSSSIRAAAFAGLFIATFAVSFYLLQQRGARQDPEPNLVSDTSGLIEPSDLSYLQSYHHYLRLDHGVDYRVETSSGNRDIDTYAAQRFSDLRIGADGEPGRGLLLVIDPDQDLVRLEVGYGLEGVFPDAFIAYVEERQMVPFFRRGRVSDGIVATTELLITRIQNAKANAGFEDEVWLEGSGGAGARTKARLGQPDTGPAPRHADVDAATTPEATLAAYMDAMRTRNASTELSIYSVATRAMLANWVTTSAQMDNVARSYLSCDATPAIFSQASDFAVIRYRIEDRQCAPWFFTFENDRWRLDLTMMQEAIRFGRGNAWRLVPGVEHPYAFAFDDWSFDRNGFPVQRNR